MWNFIIYFFAILGLLFTLLICEFKAEELWRIKHSPIVAIKPFIKGDETRWMVFYKYSLLPLWYVNEESFYNEFNFEEAMAKAQFIKESRPGETFVRYSKDGWKSYGKRIKVNPKSYL